MITLLALTAVPATALAEGTHASIFYAFTATGKPTLPVKQVFGYCWTGSLATRRADAWRCFVGNDIYDPCFASSVAPGIVVCPTAELNRAIEIRLTRPLPYDYADRGRPSLESAPWDIETVNGNYCFVITGATNIVDKQPLRYECSDNVGLWGAPAQNTKPWTILWAPFNATSLHQRIGIRHVWM